MLSFLGLCNYSRRICARIHSKSRHLLETWLNHTIYIILLLSWYGHQKLKKPSQRASNISNTLRQTHITFERSERIITCLQGTLKTEMYERTDLQNYASKRSRNDVILWWMLIWNKRWPHCIILCSGSTTAGQPTPGDRGSTTRSWIYPNGWTNSYAMSSPALGRTVSQYLHWLSN